MSTTQAQVSTVVNPLLGNGNTGDLDLNVPEAGQDTFDITVMGTTADEHTVTSALNIFGYFLECLGQAVIRRPRISDCDRLSAMATVSASFLTSEPLQPPLPSC